VSESDWEGAAAYADALQARFSADPLPWANFVIARGRALAQLGRNGTDAATVAQLERLRTQAARLGMHGEQLGIDAAVRSHPPP